MREAARQPRSLPIEARLRGCVAIGGPPGDRLSVQCHAGHTEMIGCKASAGDPGFHAAITSAPAAWAWVLVRGRPGQGIVAPFAADRSGAIDQVAAEYDAATTAGSQDDAEDRCSTRARAISRLGEG